MSEIFVFGSNLKGVHGAGAALHARKNFGAQLGVGFGRTGDAYAIPTKSTPYVTMSLPEIEPYIYQFVLYAKDNPMLTFKVTAIGTGLAGYRHDVIAKLFKGSPRNCVFDKRWESILGNEYRYF